MTLKIIHFVPDTWGPFVDIRACLMSLASRSAHTSVVSTDFDRLVKESDSETLIITWEPLDPGPTERRDCYVASIYSEALDSDETKMLHQHRVHWQLFKKIMHNYDLIFVHTPQMRELLIEACMRPVQVMPVGWDLAVMGVPRWDAPKHTQIGFHGSLVGRRTELIPALRAKYGAGEFVDMTGTFGRELLGRLDTTQVSLYVAHSLVQSFSTWRLWQLASTSAVLLAESGDSWPFRAGEHFIELPRLTSDNLDEIAGGLLDLTRRDLTQIAINAHQLARTYTLDAIEAAYVMPAFEEVRG